MRLISPNRLKTFFTILAVIGILQISSGCSTNDSTAEKIQPLAVRVESPQYRDISDHLTYIGSIHATNEILVIAQVQGTVESIPFDEGMPFKKGDLLIKLSVPDLEAAVNKLEAEYSYWDQHLKEDIKLLEKNAISQEQVDISKKAFETSRASLAEVKSRLDKANETASYNGVVLKHFVEPGQHVMPGQSLLLVGNNLLEMHVEVVQEDINKGIKVGTPVTIITNSGKFIDSKVASIASAALGRGRTFTVKIPFPSEFTQDLRIGEALTVNFILNQKKQILSVPAKAVLNKDGKQFIFLIKNNKAVRTSVTLGVEQSGWVSIDFDWNGSDLVAVSNIASLSDSSAVYPVKDESY